MLCSIAYEVESESCLRANWHDFLRVHRPLLVPPEHLHVRLIPGGCRPGTVAEQGRTAVFKATPRRRDPFREPLPRVRVTAGDPLRAGFSVANLAGLVHVPDRRDPAFTPILGHDASAGQPVSRARARRKTTGTRVRLRDGRGRPQAGAASQLCPGPDPPPRGDPGRRVPAALPDC